jgi:putative transposase
MSRNYYSEINLHITWHCKDSLPLLTPQVQPLAQRYVRQRMINTPAAFVHETGGTETNMHVVATIPPTLAISDFIGQLKGATSHDVNSQLGSRGRILQWQAGYGVVSFGTKDLEWVRQYVRSQREHHTCGTTIERLERIIEAEPRAQGQQPRERG